MKMKKSSLVPVVLAVLALSSWAAHSAGNTAMEIMQRVDARNDGDNRTARLTMTLIDRNNRERRRSLETFFKYRGRDRLNLMFFLAPASVRNTGFLTYDYRSPEQDDDQWLYLPELRKTKRIASANKSQSFMGTDFSYVDMTRRVLEEWNYKLLGERDVRGKLAWLVEATPASEVVERRYGYAKSVLFVRQDIDMVVRAVHWLTEGQRLKYLDIKTLERINGIWTATELDMRTVRNKETLHRTVMRFEDVRYDQDLDEGLFSLRRLERGT